MLNEIQYRHCPCCGCCIVRIVATPHNAHLDGVPVTSNYDVVSCEKCGFSYADTKATSTEYSHYYSFFSKYSPPTTGQPVFSAEQKIIFSRLANKISKHCPNKELLIGDFGCGNGGLLSELRKQGFRNLVGYDASPDCVDFLKSQGMMAHSYQLGEELPTDAKFDAIILTQVLEHLLEPLHVLSVLKNHLEEDGLIFIEVPDATKFCGCVSTLCYEFNIEHINYYSEITLSNLIKTAGFEVLDIQSYILAISPEFCPILSIAGKKSSLCKTILAYDGEISRSLKRYAVYSDIFLKGLISKLQEVLNDNDEICFWGAGALLSAILGTNEIDMSKVKCVIDSNRFYRNLSISSVPIVSPGDFFSTSSFAALPIVISSIRAEQSIRETIEATEGDRSVYSLIL